MGDEGITDGQLDQIIITWQSRRAQFNAPMTTEERMARELKGARGQITILNTVREQQSTEIARLNANTEGAG